MKIYRLLRILSYFTFGKTRHKIKQKYYEKKAKAKSNNIINKNKKMWDKNNNKLIIVDQEGNINISHDNKSYGIESIDFRGQNSSVTIHEPCLLTNPYFFLLGNCSIVIHKNTSIGEKNQFFCSDRSSITIGEDCMFSWGILIHSSDHHTIINSQNKILNQPKKTIIGNHVWIGHNAIILKNSIVPDNSIIAAGSVFTSQSYNPNQEDEIIGLNGRVFMGNPARCVKHGDFTWKRERIADLQELLNN